jgi:hypothetical protein
MHDPGEEMELRVKAAAIILQRGWGDAPKEATLRLVNEQRTAAEMSDAELMRCVLASLPPPIVVEAEVADTS